MSKDMPVKTIKRCVEFQKGKPIKWLIKNEVKNGLELKYISIFYM